MLDRMVAAGAGIVPMPRIHSLALRLARVAHGELDAAMAGGNGHDWDLAAADLLVHEAGGVMTALDGRDADLQSSRAGARRPDCSGTRAPRSAGRSGARSDQRAGVTACAQVRAMRRNNHVCYPIKTTASSRHRRRADQSIDSTEFKDLDKVDIVGVYPNYADGPRRLEGEGAADRRQRADAVFHRSPAPAARSRGDRSGKGELAEFCCMASLRKLTRSPWF